MPNLQNNKREYIEEWNFKEFSMSEYIHTIHSYPAMMMPRIARNFIHQYASKNSVILDPYMGSGTTLLEGMVENVKKVIGFDLNPLAVLIATVKTTKFDLDEIKKEIDNLDYNLSKLVDYNRPTFSILESWFKEDTIEDLSKLKTIINSIDNDQTRLFFMLVFSKTVRFVSLTRNGEFKLYKIAESKRGSHNPDTINIFFQKLILTYETIKDFYENTNFLESNTEIQITNDALINSNIEPNSIDLVVTSPPYGDSGTTVAYGQFSRLANEWLDFPDPIKLDSKLMGGTRIKDEIKFDIPELDNAVTKIKEIEAEEKTKRAPSVISFYKDYEESIKKVSEVVKPNGTVIYVVGNRRVRNVELPTDIITAKMFERLGFTHEKTIVRDIINKRMPSKTSPSNNRGQKTSTMTYEYIVVLHKK
ncbi:DNA methylase [Streptococcus mitis]|uniref:site-specific DNA-methyltransferase (cytosine-N(4)-specific) n=2 Tax=Streptococcus TaxID=1301 RepID=A0A3R9R7L9_STRMT|nr:MULTISPECIES: DNA methyltransferase [Streptococcus]RSI78502.1 DNA methylase [Streptococcus mitis]RSJ06098.1 DNA methylase [Streptococcus mitis]RSJ65960.1 DNA methylase [Streptococcus oralis]